MSTIIQILIPLLVLLKQVYLSSAQGEQVRQQLRSRRKTEGELRQRRVESIYQNLTEVEQISEGSPASSTRCFDVRGWHDSSFLDCDWYAWGDNCIEFGFSPGILGLTANEACCSCKARLPPKPDSEDDFNLMVMVFQTNDNPQENDFWLENDEQGRIWDESGDTLKQNERYVFSAWIPSNGCTSLNFMSSRDAVFSMGSLGFVKIIVEGRKDNEIYYNWNIGQSFMWTSGQDCESIGFIGRDEP